jgi:hypothetical protein
MRSIFEKVIEAKKGLDPRENLVENFLQVFDNGKFETLCCNEFGGLYGPVYEGWIELTAEELLYIKEYTAAGNHAYWHI